jgi:hypothetical protein
MDSPQRIVLAVYIDVTDLTYDVYMFIELIDILCIT